MDDAICLSDDDEDNECILIEETTLVVTGEKKEQNCSTSSYSLMDAIASSSSNRHRSQPISSNAWLDSGMSELDHLIREKQMNRRVSDDDDDDDDEEVMVADSGAAGTSSGSSRPEKRKLTEDERETQRKLKEHAKRARQAEKERKAMEKDQKKGEQVKKREEKEREKETRKVEREISAALNSKCELYTFCHIGKTVMDYFPGLEAELRVLYTERKIENQLEIEPSLGTRIEWRRKCVELKEDEEGKSERFEYMSTQNLFAVVVKADTLKEVIGAGSLSDFIVEQRHGFQNGRCTMLIISFGKLDLPKPRLHRMALEIYETHRAQIVQIDTIPELALFTAQYLRSLARREKKRAEVVGKEESSQGGGGGGGAHRLQYQGEKGIVTGSRREIVFDWWSKMLSTIDRLSDAQRRAILDRIPDPIAGIEKYSKMDYSMAIQEIAELMAENGRRVGPAIAHRVITMLTDETGNALVE